MAIALPTGVTAADDRVKLQLPILGPVNKKIVIARFNRTFGTLVASGVPIMQALEVGWQRVSPSPLSCTHWLSKFRVGQIADGVS
ncbi:MAG TPA: hypothetical protein VJT32_05365 [bacterium]|nr:hypothetical protein [bacterium]